MLMVPVWPEFASRSARCRPNLSDPLSGRHPAALIGQDLSLSPREFRQLWRSCAWHMQLAIAAAFGTCNWLVRGIPGV
jgi:hypothetical protein